MIGCIAFSMNSNVKLVAGRRGHAFALSSVNTLAIGVLCNEMPLLDFWHCMYRLTFSLAMDDQ